jgi:hypothetical protein
MVGLKSRGRIAGIPARVAPHRETVLLEMAALHGSSMPGAMLSAKQVESLGSGLGSRFDWADSPAAKRYPRRFIGKIRFGCGRVVMRGKKQKKKWAPLGCPLLAMSGSSTWARTRDLRINSPMVLDVVGQPWTTMNTRPIGRSSNVVL